MLNRSFHYNVALKFLWCARVLSLLLLLLFEDVGQLGKAFLLWGVELPQLPGGGKAPLGLIVVTHISWTEYW